MLITSLKIIREHEASVLYNVKSKHILAWGNEECIYQLLQPTINEQPYMCDSFSMGNLYQVSKEIYGIYISSRFDYDQTLTCINKDTTVSVVKGTEAATVVLQKGQAIPNTGYTV